MKLQYTLLSYVYTLLDENSGMTAWNNCVSWELITAFFFLVLPSSCGSHRPYGKIVTFYIFNSLPVHDGIHFL